MSVFHVQKTPVEVELWTTDGDLSGVLHLAPFARSHGGSETVLDVMAGPEAFVPITYRGGVGLFAKRSVLAVWYRPERPTGADESWVQHRALIHLHGRAPFEVVLAEERPPDRARLSDFLNDGAPFLVATCDEQQVLLSKQHLVRVAPVGDGAPPQLGTSQAKAGARPAAKKPLTKRPKPKRRAR